MKIVHVSVNSFFTDGFTYQDNILPKYHKLLGNDVSIITSKFCFKEGKIVLDDRDEYINENGIKVIRLKSKYDNNFSRNSFKAKFNVYYNIYGVIEHEKPDILFIHGVNFLDIKRIVKYLKFHPDVKVYVDNHADYSNSATNFFSKYVLHRIIWKHYAKMIEPFAIKFYGVLPARVDFLIDNYKISKSKCELLLMGADDEWIKEYCNDSTKKRLKKELKLTDNDFVIVTGGKIDLAKKQTLLLMEAVERLKKGNVKLVIFGSVADEIKPQFDDLCNKNKNIYYVGWVSNELAYQYFNVADLVVFPGRHSVYWEIVVAIGKPLICKKWAGTNHVDIGGNVIFLEKDTCEELQEKLSYLLDDNANMQKLLAAATQSKKNDFLYSNIAKKSIGVTKDD